MKLRTRTIAVMALIAGLLLPRPYPAQSLSELTRGSFQRSTDCGALRTSTTSRSEGAVPAAEEGEPQVDLFLSRVSREFPCNGNFCAANAAERLARVGRDPVMRKVVWKRIIHQELLYAPTKVLRRIELIASECRMPIV